MREMVLQVTDEEHAILAAFLDRRYEAFLDYGGYVLGIRGDGGEEYVCNTPHTLREPGATAVTAAALNGLLRSAGLYDEGTIPA